jgi:hypothetical protein
MFPLSCRGVHGDFMAFPADVKTMLDVGFNPLLHREFCLIFQLWIRNREQWQACLPVSITYPLSFPRSMQECFDQSLSNAKFNAVRHSPTVVPQSAHAHIFVR